MLRLHGWVAQGESSRGLTLSTAVYMAIEEVFVGQESPLSLQHAALDNVGVLNRMADFS